MTRIWKNADLGEEIIKARMQSKRMKKNLKVISQEVGKWTVEPHFRGWKSNVTQKLDFSSRNTWIRQSSTGCAHHVFE